MAHYRHSHKSNKRHNNRRKKHKQQSHKQHPHKKPQNSASDSLRKTGRIAKKTLNFIAWVVGWLTILSGMVLIIFIFAVIFRALGGYGTDIPRGLLLRCVKYSGYFFIIFFVLFLLFAATIV